MPELLRKNSVVVLLQLDRFFFQLQTAIPQTTNDTPYFKLVSFWPLKKGIRILGVGSSVKEELKEKAYLIKEAQNLQNLLPPPPPPVVLGVLRKGVSVMVVELVGGMVVVGAV